MFFYELREGDDDIFADVLLVREEEMDADSFFELVQEIRRRVQDTFEQDTLIEAIAEELERDHDFIAISDDRLTASVNVSKTDDDNYLAGLDSDDDEDDGRRLPRHLRGPPAATPGPTERSGRLAAPSRSRPPTASPDLVSDRGRERPIPAVEPGARRPPPGVPLPAEQDLDHVAVADAVGLALGTQLAVLARLGHRSRGQQVLVAARPRRG